MAAARSPAAPAGARRHPPRRRARRRRGRCRGPSGRRVPRDAGR
ncbi:hypothetical protein Ae263Ps1_5955 [Pseudonocardia sp. Ae263_Ps1]|nr:hypothetical protein Ae263Ps1_5955 [Pseudonocardia sp. Ae263_Ps1]OLL91075.1 hypothetical protein Ae356Ps1_0972c [Pseudonocardia sp. Ae356_Ps1]